MEEIFLYEFDGDIALGVAHLYTNSIIPKYSNLKGTQIRYTSFIKIDDVRIIENSHTTFNDYEDYEKLFEKLKLKYSEEFI